MASIAIMIGTPQGSRLLAFSSERKAAIATEAILRRLPAKTLPAPLWVQAADPHVRSRLTTYLTELQAELVAG